MVIKHNRLQSLAKSRSKAKASWGCFKHSMIVQTVFCRCKWLPSLSSHVQMLKLAWMTLLKLFNGSFGIGCNTDIAIFIDDTCPANKSLLKWSCSFNCWSDRLDWFEILLFFKLSRLDWISNLLFLFSGRTQAFGVWLLFVFNDNLNWLFGSGRKQFRLIR